MAIDFDGADDYLNCASGATIDGLFDAVGSIAIWVYLDTYGELDYGNIARKSWLLRPRNTGGIYVNQFTFFHSFDGGANPGVWRCDGAATGSWIHFAIIYDNSATTNDPIIYVNAVSKAITEVSTPSGTRDDDSASTLIIGGDGSGGETFDGRMEDFRAYKRALTAEEVSALAAGYRGPLGGEVCWLSMNEARTLATPGTLTQGTHTLSDLSINSNDGDPYGDAVLVASDCPRMGMVV